MGGCDKQGFPMKQGVLTPGRVRLLLHRGEWSDSKIDIFSDLCDMELVNIKKRNRVILISFCHQGIGLAGNSMFRLILLASFNVYTCFSIVAIVGWCPIAPLSFHGSEQLFPSLHVFFCKTGS